MIADFDDTYNFVANKFLEAEDGAEEIRFPVESFAMSEGVQNQKEGGFRIRASAITDIPEYEVLKHGTGQSAWAAILAVDLRQSSRRAEEIGARQTYLTMHTYLPTMAHLVGKSDGYVVGMRGDGLFAAFGVSDFDSTEIDGSKAVQSAISCGKAMTEAVDEIINPVLRKNNVKDGLAIGVGVDIGKVVITRIGLQTANEVTAYGAAVNHACKKYASHGRNEIRVSQAAWEMFPSSKGGTVKMTQGSGYCLVQYPANMNMLGGTAKRRRRKSA